MATNSGIEWTEATWNPSVGCTKISPGCKFCYASIMHRRLTAMTQPKYADPFSVVKPWEAHLHEPLKWREPRLIFVNSMSDLFHRDMPLDYIQKVFAVMKLAQQHTFQVLTKRSDRLLDLHTRLEWAPNVWMGVSVESNEYLWRVEHLREVGAAVRFLSLEPLLGPLPDLDLAGIHWVIVGGESGPGARPMDKAWVVDIQKKCQDEGVPFFFKQWGGVQKHTTGRDLGGRTWNEMPG